MDIRDRYGYTALHLSSMSGHLETVPLLLCHGAHASIRNDFGDTAQMAVYRSTNENNDHADNLENSDNFELL